MVKTRVLLGCVLVLAGCFEEEGRKDDKDAKTPDSGMEDAGTSGDGDAGEEDSGVPVDDPENSLPAVEDPYPEANEAGEYTCDGCPQTSDFTDFEPDLGAVTASEFSGVVTDADGPGVFYVSNEAGQAFAGPIDTNPDTGSYAVTVPLLCGEQKVKFVWGNKQGKYASVLDAKTTDCVPADIRATLVWGSEGRDFELHLVREGGTINDRTGDRYYSNDCTWNTCIGGSADWGVEGDATDDPRKDVDNTGTFGPENIFYSKPETGRYTVLVEHWGQGAATADGTLILNVAGQKTVAIPITDLAPQWVFTAATIDWPSGEIRRVETQYNCSGDWASGCLAEIPKP